MMTTFKLIAVILLVLGNGFFVAAEFALVGMRRSRVDQLIAEGKKAAIPVKRAVDNLDMYLAATQLGITITSLALGWIGEPALAHLIEPAFHWLPEAWVQAGAHTGAIALAFIIITALHIVLGELAPKSLALQRAEGVSLVVAKPLELFLLIFKPAIITLNTLGNWVVHLFGLQSAGEGHAVHSAAELEMLVESSSKQGALGQEESVMIRGVFRMADQPVGAVMTPRPKIVWLNLDDSMETLAENIRNSPYSRMPVAQDNIENLVGVLDKRDLSVNGLPKTREELREILRKPLYIPTTAASLKVIKQLRDTNHDIAIVVSEYGGIEGLLTQQDIVDSITSNVLLEAGETQHFKQQDGSWLLNAFMPIDQIKDAFHLPPLPEEGSYHTLGGFMLQQFNHVPEVGENIIFGHMKFEIADMLGTRIVHVRISSVEPEKITEE